MNEILSKPELFSAIKAGILGLMVGGVFGLLRIQPPSPDNLSGIFGIVGIFAGWILVRYINN